MSNNPQNKLESDICIHIFVVSAGMVGVCLTVIGLLRVVISIKGADTIADDLVAGDAMLFLASTMLSYIAIRSRSKTRMHRVERIADFIFICAIVLMAAICAFITYAIAVGGNTIVPVPSN